MRLDRSPYFHILTNKEPVGLQYQQAVLKRMVTQVAILMAPHRVVNMWCPFKVVVVHLHSAG